MTRWECPPARILRKARAAPARPPRVEHAAGRAERARPRPIAIARRVRARPTDAARCFHVGAPCVE
eukprot:10806088-Alexandrium_andersonii.AAC.1